MRRITIAGLVVASIVGVLAAQSVTTTYTMRDDEQLVLICAGGTISTVAQGAGSVQSTCAIPDPPPPPPPPPPPVTGFPSFTGQFVTAPMQGTPLPPANAEQAPTCPAELHNPVAWHPLYMPASLLTVELRTKLERAGVPAGVVSAIGLVGCHYAHTHNANPEVADAIFGPAGSLWGGQTLSYPWETMNAAGGHENHLKHEGYKYMVERDLPVTSTDLNWQIGPNHRVTDTRIQYHALGGPADATVRLHSYFAEMRVCHKSQPLQCGIAQFGGWADYGALHVPYKQRFVPLPGQDPVPLMQSLNEDPYRAHAEFEDGPWVAARSDSACKTCGRTGFMLRWLWTTSPRYGFNQVGGQFIIAHDDWQGIDASNPSRLELACDPDRNPCRLNNTEHQPFTLWTWVPPSFDQSALDTDASVGFVSYVGYTTRQGVIVQGCASPGLDCVPLRWVHMPTGYGGWNTPTNDGRDVSRWRDFDVSPGKVWWVRYPN